MLPASDDAPMCTPRRLPPARRLTPPRRPWDGAAPVTDLAARRAPVRRPSVGPRGSVAWWERPAPGGDEALWGAVVAIHDCLQRRGIAVSALARRLEAHGVAVRRETLSRVLNGSRRTSWRLVDSIALVLGIDLPDDSGGLDVAA